MGSSVSIVVQLEHELGFRISKCWVGLISPLVGIKHHDSTTPDPVIL